MEFNDSNKAIYLQIADAIADDVVMHRLRPDERIPSVREYAARVMVNVNTVMRSYEHLSSLGVIYNKRGLGFFVAPDGAARVKAQRRSHLIDDGGITLFFKQMQLLDVSPAELAEMYTQYLNKQ